MASRPPLEPRWSFPVTRSLRWAAILVLMVRPVPGLADERPPVADVLTPPVSEDFLILPLRVHILTSSDLPEVDCRLTDADITRIVRKVNGIWDKAGIHWGLESIRREPAARQARFRLARDLDSAENLGIFRLLIPETTRSSEGHDVYFLHKFPVNGVWFGEAFVIVQETASLRRVEGGIDEPIPRVTAHELGHALGLSHRQDRTNLLASGTTGTRLNTDEVATARRQASRQKGVMTTAEVRTKAEDAVRRGEVETARRLWSWLSEVPGDGAAEARMRLQELDPVRDRP